MNNVTMYQMEESRYFSRFNYFLEKFVLKKLLIIELYLKIMVITVDINGQRKANSNTVSKRAAKTVEETLFSRIF